MRKRGTLTGNAALCHRCLGSRPMTSSCIQYLLGAPKLEHIIKVAFPEGRQHKTCEFYGLFENVLIGFTILKNTEMLFILL